jgi:NAD(P)-dependent dehydrogenase (short-subunit alcohol dehydrogenase family)
MTALLNDKVCMVTGAASGIGRETAIAAAQAGARIVVTDINDVGGEETAAIIREGGGEAIFVRADITVEDEVAAVVAQAIETYGRLDCACNNAGMSPAAKPLHEIPTDAFRKLVDVNLMSAFFCMKHQVPAMLDRGSGSIVNVASVAGLVGIAHCGDYAASKHGVVGMTKVAALDYATSGIRVNAVAPGGVRTPLLVKASDSDPALMEHSKAAHPIGRVGEPREVADAIVWLLSDQAGFVTGACLPIDGGSTAR